MPRRFFKTFLPSHTEMKARWYLRPFDALLHDPALWATHRKSVVRALALGLFIAYLPVPFHAALAALGAIYLRVNVPVAVVSVFVVNPLTVVPSFLAAYWIGTWLLGTPHQEFNIDWSWQWMTDTLPPIWKPLVLGSLILATSVALIGYLGLDTLWRLSLAYRYKKRRRTRASRRLAQHRPQE